MRKCLIRILGLKGSWKWALKQMLNGNIVRPKGATGTVRYRFSRDDQNRIQWTFDKQAPIWKNANMFYSDFMGIDWVTD